MRDVSNKRCKVRSGTSTVGVEGGEDARASKTRARAEALRRCSGTRGRTTQPSLACFSSSLPVPSSPRLGSSLPPTHDCVTQLGLASPIDITPRLARPRVPWTHYGLFRVSDNNTDPCLYHVVRWWRYPLLWYMATTEPTHRR